MTYLLLFATSAAITLALTPVMRNFFRRTLGWVDHIPIAGASCTRESHPAPRRIPDFHRLLQQPAIAALSARFAGHHLSPRRSANLQSAVAQPAGSRHRRMGRYPRNLAVRENRGAVGSAGYWLYAQGISINHIGVPGTNGISLGVLESSRHAAVDCGNHQRAEPCRRSRWTRVRRRVSLRPPRCSSWRSSSTITTSRFSLPRSPGSTLAFLRFANFNPATVFSRRLGKSVPGIPARGLFNHVVEQGADSCGRRRAAVRAGNCPIAEVGISIFRVASFAGSRSSARIENTFTIVCSARDSPPSAPCCCSTASAC